MSAGVGKAWETLRGLDSSDVCLRASVSFDEEERIYILRSFCFDFSISPEKKTIINLAPEGEALIKQYGYFFVHSALWYLIEAKNIPDAGRLIKPENLKGGGQFFRGTHVLPLDAVAEKYGQDRDSFINKGKTLCAEPLGYGDASIRLLPMPKMPVTLILWLRDEEFPPRADLLFDSSCQMQLPLDIIWSVAMMSLLVML